MKKCNLVLTALLSIVLLCAGYSIYKIRTAQKKFAIVLQAGKETHEGMARALHALLYATELKEKGYDVVLIFDGAGTEWAEELSNPDSQSKLLPMYQSLKKTGVVEVICDFCSLAFGVNDKLKNRQANLVSEYQGHPSIEKWIRRGYVLIIL
ncbi:MAG: DsrE family protein [Candidatus Omnitrophota bacterium]|nr:DsrE family protein [Candidatus Omnitrophota bacterium]